MEDKPKSKEYLELEKRYEEQKKNIKLGDNVVHLEYLGAFVDNETISEIEKEFKNAKLELSKFDYYGFPQASYEEFRNSIFLAIQYPFISDILFGIGFTLVWDTLKFAIKSVWKKVRKKSAFKLTSTTKESCEITFGVKVRLSGHRQLNFRINGDFSEELVDKSLDKMIDLLREEKDIVVDNDNAIHDYFLTFNRETDLWDKVNVLEEVRKNIHKNKNNNAL